MIHSPIYSICFIPCKECARCIVTLFIFHISVTLSLCKDSANREKHKINRDLFLIPRCRLSSPRAE